MAQDEYQVIGWLFTAKDEASAVAQQAYDSIKTVSKNIGSTLSGVPDAISDVVKATTGLLESEWAEKVGDAILSPVDFLEDAFANVFGDLGETVLDTALAPFDAVGDTLLDLGKGVKDAFVGIAGDVSDVFSSVWSFATKVDLSFKDIGAGMARLAGGSVKMLVGGLGKLGMAGVSAGVKMGGLVRSLFSVGDMTDKFGRSGGLVGALLGPLAPIMRLLDPLISMISDGLSPAMETFTSILETSFAPLFELAEMLAQTFAPMVQEFIKPFAEVLEVVAVQAAGFVASLFKMDDATVGVASLFESLGPVIQNVFRALGGLARELLPIVLDTFSDLAPIAVEVVKIIGQFAGDLLPELGAIAKQVLPPLLKAFAAILQAVLPLLPPLTKLAVILVEKVFGPALIAAAEWLSGWITNDVVPFIDEYMPAAVMVIEEIADRVSDFFSNLGKYSTQFKVLFIDPIIGWFGGAYDSAMEIIQGFRQKAVEMLTWLGEQARGVLDALGLGGIGSKVEGIFKSIAGIIQAPIEGIRKVINDYIIDTMNDILSADLPVIGNLAGIIFDDEGYRIPRLQHGGIIDAVPGGREVIVGEGGAPEAVVPLTTEAVADFIQPALRGMSVEVSLPEVTVPDITAAIGSIDLAPVLDVPVLREALDFLRDIRGALTGTLTVEMDEAAPERRGSDEWAGMNRAVGLSGVTA